MLWHILDLQVWQPIVAYLNQPANHGDVLSIWFWIWFILVTKKNR